MNMPTLEFLRNGLPAPLTGRPGLASVLAVLSLAVLLPLIISGLLWPLLDIALPGAVSDAVTYFGVTPFL